MNNSVCLGSGPHETPHERRETKRLSNAISFTRREAAPRISNVISNSVCIASASQRGAIAELSAMNSLPCTASSTPFAAFHKVQGDDDPFTKFNFLSTLP